MRLQAPHHAGGGSWRAGPLLHRVWLVRLGQCSVAATLWLLRLAWPLLLLLLALPAQAAPADQGSPASPYTIRSGQEAAVEGLLAPWREGHELSGGASWVGTEIKHERICFVLKADRGGEGRVCLALSERAPALLKDRSPTAVSGRVVAGWEGGPFEPPVAAALTAQVAAQIRTSTSDSALLALWSVPERDSPLPQAVALIVLVWLLFVGRKEARELPGGGLVWIGGLLAVSALVRVCLSPAAPMEAWSWTRVTEGGELAAQLPLLRSWFEPQGVWFNTAESTVILVMASLTPVALFCHAARLFGDARVAMASAVLLALSPHHIRFSAGPTQFVPSLLVSSLTFYWTYQTVDASKLLERLIRLGILPLLLWHGFGLRPLNFFFAPLMIAAIAIAARLDAKAWRAAVAAVIAATAAAWLFHQRQSYLHATEGNFVDVVLFGLRKLFLSPQWNPLTFWRLTPPVWPPLIAAGFAILWTSPWQTLAPSVAKARAMWLMAWLFGFLALHSVAVVDEPMNNARYQLHSLPAMAMLAGAGLMGLWWHVRGRRWAVAALVPALAAPMLHEDSIRDVGFDVMRERAFLESLRDDPHRGVPAGCNVIELMRTRDGHGLTSRIDRVIKRVAAAPNQPPYWRRVVLQPNAAVGGNAAAQLSPYATGLTKLHQAAPATAPLELLDDATARVQALSGCVAFYEGPECARGPGDRRRHPACEQVLAAGDWELGAQAHFIARIYDHGLSDFLHRNGDEVTLRLWRRRSQ